MEISPALHEIIVAVSRKAVDERMEEMAVTRRDFDEVRVAIRDLATAQTRTEQRLEELAAAQTRTEQRLERLEAAVERLAEAQARTEERVTRLQDTVGDIKGRQLELTYQERAATYFGPLLRRLRVVSLIKLEDDLESSLSLDEFKDLLRLAMLISGRPRHLADAPQVWLAVEVSAVVDRHDVERARRHAATLRRAGYRAIPTVAGEQVTAGAKEGAFAHKMLLLQNGKALFWEEALEEVLSG